LFCLGSVGIWNISNNCLLRSSWVQW
jgi:hypothetical protein